MKRNRRVFVFGFFVLPPFLCFIAWIIKLKFFTFEKHWLLLSFVYAIAFLIGIFTAFEIVNSMKKLWMIILMEIGIFLTMLIVLTIIDKLCYALLNWKITETCDTIYSVFTLALMWNTFGTLELFDEKTEETD